MKITRTYNSNATYIGLFGYGWGSDYESNLIISPSGLPVVFANGSGAIMKFKPLAKKIYYKNILNKNIKFMKKTLTEDENTKDSKIIKDNLERFNYRLHEWKKLLSQKKVIPEPIELNEEFIYDCSCSSGTYTLKRVINGYELTNNKQKEYFNLKGELTSITYANNDTVNVNRDKRGRIRSLDYRKNKVYFFYNQNGQVDRIYDPRSDLVLYKYDGNNLIHALDIENNEFKYKYDNKHNMTQISYSDNTFLKIQYYNDKDQVKEITQRDGTRQIYKYGYMDDSNLNYYTEVWIPHFINKNEPKDIERIEFYFQQDDQGEQLLSKKVTIADNIRSEYFYNKKEILKQVIKSSELLPNKKVKLDYKFYKTGNVKKVSGKDWVKEYTYKEGTSLVKSIMIKSNTVENKYTYEYDNINRLIYAQYGSHKINIIYVNKKDKKIKSISYNKHSLEVIDDIQKYKKHIKFRIKEIGDFTLTLEYDKKMKIKKIQSSDSRKALLASSILSGIFSICAPAKAGITLEDL